MKKIVYTFFFYESLCQIARDKVMEGVSGHAADVLLSSSSITNKTTATESTKVGHVYGLTITWTSFPSFAEKQKVGGVSGNPLCYLT